MTMRALAYRSCLATLLLMASLSALATDGDADTMGSAIRQGVMGTILDGSSTPEWRWLDGQGTLVTGTHGRYLRFEGSQRGSGFSVSFDAAPYRGTWFAVDVEFQSDHGGWVGPRYFMTAEGKKPFFDPTLTRQACVSTDDGWRKCTIYGYVPTHATRLTADIVGFRANYTVRRFSVGKVGPDTDAEAMAQKTADFERTVTLMKTHFFRARQVDWTALAAQGRGWLKMPSRTAWISAIAWISAQLPSDGHTYVKALPSTDNERSRDSMPSAANEVAELGKGVGYVKLVGTPEAPDARQVYANETRRHVRALVDKGATSWVIDLRGNHGGSLYAMLNALSPLMGAGQLGYLEFEDGTRQAFGMLPSGAYLTGRNRFDVTHIAQSMTPDDPVSRAVARRYVIIDHGCASACESVAVALRGMPGTQIVGEASAGLTTGNAAYPLGTDFRLVLTESFIQDVKGERVYPRVEPTVVLSGPEKDWLDEVVKKIPPG